jgi:tRNA pseudouridine55 synthase
MDLIFNLNKPKGITSQEATTEIKKIFKAKKAGHTGTLDPSATGVLLVCINRATRLASYFSSLKKEYKAVLKLGETTDTQDAQGTVIERSEQIEVDEPSLKNVLKSFRGEIFQKPPMFSALKHKGRPLYKYAHRGIDIPRKPRAVHIDLIELLDINLPYASIMVLCSKGTYIRTLCDDIGKKLGCGAHLFKLERTAIDSFSTKDSLTIGEIRAIRTDSGSGQTPYAHSGIYTMNDALSWMPELKIKDSQVRHVMNGNPIKPNATEQTHILKTAEGIKIKSSEGELLAIGSYLAEKNMIKMDVVFPT